MLQSISALFAGTLFGVGLTVSQMVNPAKVIGFLDIFGNWDPSLAFVMGGALLVTTIGFRLVHKKDKPFFTTAFDIPSNRKVDARLASGSVLFGIGWGLVGLCPGPAVAALSIGGLPILVFLCAMIMGAYLFELMNKKMASAQNGQKPEAV